MVLTVVPTFLHTFLYFDDTVRATFAPFGTTSPANFVILELLTVCFAFTTKPEGAITVDICEPIAGAVVSGGEDELVVGAVVSGGEDELGGGAGLQGVNEYAFDKEPSLEPTALQKVVVGHDTPFNRSSCLLLDVWKDAHTSPLFVRTMFSRPWTPTATHSLLDTQDIP